MRMRLVEREDWNRKHGEAGPLFGVEPNRFLVAEVEDLAPVSYTHLTLPTIYSV